MNTKTFSSPLTTFHFCLPLQQTIPTGKNVQVSRDGAINPKAFLREILWVLFLGALAFAGTSQSFAQSRPGRPEKLANGVLVPIGDGFLKVEVCNESVIRVAYAKDRAFFDRSTLAAAPKRCETAAWNLTNDPKEATLSTTTLRAKIDLATGTVGFFDRNGQPIVMEKKGGRALTPAEVQGERTFHVRQEWQANPDESLYGLGQHQLGLMDIKGYDLELWQRNTTVAVPFLVSSRGYGILWDNTSWTRFGDLRQFEFIPSDHLFDASGKRGGLTGSYYAGATFDRQVATRLDPRIDIATPDRQQHPHTRIHPDLPPTGDISVRWEGSVEAPTTGDYLFQTYSNSGVKLWIDDQLVINHWRQGWLPWKDISKLHLDAKRRHHLKAEWTRDQGEETMQLFWKMPAASADTSLWSEVGDGTDYYFMYGPEIDQVIAGYRRVTGEAPMMPLWAYGLWQCRQRYETQQQSLDILEGFRSRRIPIDTIVQDWFYWKADQWGSHEFDPERYPDPVGWIKAIHDKYHARLMISVWPKFYPNTENAKALRARGFLYEKDLHEGEKDWVNYVYTYYDAFSPEARRIFWSQMDRELFRKGVDAWWMDATEPELVHGPELEGTRTHMNPTALGSGSRMLNAYPLVNSQAVYEGQRAAVPNQRVFILTRSGFAGQQRYASATWSGDISSTWTAMRKQISAGLGFSLSGMPYWTMDAGGFSVPTRFSVKNPAAADVEEWREMNTRWFQFATFVPLLRVHGEFPYREMWYFGGESHPAYQTMLKFDRIRYRMLPYVYSLAGGVTQHGGTMMRALVMDFRNDPKARGIADEYMFGPALLVNPVTTYKARSRSVYLPRAAGWYDFWNGAESGGGQTIEVPAPYDALPLYVKAGSIIPFGPELQYTAEKPADPITLYVYTGADGSFTLYEDEGLNYDYEKGAFTLIPIKWDQARQTLTIGKRAGSFPGMLTARTFNVVFVARAKPVGFSFTPKPDHTVSYSGDAVEIAAK
jgi:alpha-D-xyloside xylohydrolase